MSTPTAKSFTAVLELDHTELRWVIARVPFDPAKAWPVRRGMRVRGEIASRKSKTGSVMDVGKGFAFRTTLFPDPRGEGYFLLVNKKMQAAAKATAGSQVQIRLEPDLEERAVVIPPELTRALKGDRRLPKWFASMSDSMRRYIGAWVGEPKSAASRERRAEMMAERMLLTIEGESELPPILHAAFLRQPLAREGWEAMTPVQRRGHLLGIFGYQGVGARERRAAKAVEEALRVARRKSGIEGPEIE
ncbi:MAG: YdeI/OmpD-associated family protein [Terracidiphilus sp.]|jgi:uncharacterized protein YdeI (YjbR/CyaY-like superfamily)